MRILEKDLKNIPCFQNNFARGTRRHPLPAGIKAKTVAQNTDRQQITQALWRLRSNGSWMDPGESDPDPRWSNNAPRFFFLTEERKKKTRNT